MIKKKLSRQTYTAHLWKVVIVSKTPNTELDLDRWDKKSTIKNYAKSGGCYGNARNGFICKNDNPPNVYQE